MSEGGGNKWESVKEGKKERGGGEDRHQLQDSYSLLTELLQIQRS